MSGLVFQCSVRLQNRFCTASSLPKLLFAVKICILICVPDNKCLYRNLLQLPSTALQNPNFIPISLMWCEIRYTAHVNYVTYSRNSLCNTVFTVNVNVTYSNRLRDSLTGASLLVNSSSDSASRPQIICTYTHLINFSVSQLNFICNCCVSTHNFPRVANAKWIKLSHRPSAHSLWHEHSLTS